MTRVLYLKLVAVIIFLGINVYTAFSQSPESISYQAVVRDADNNLVTEHNIGVQISIIQGTATGSIVYVETHNPTTNENGLVSVEIGAGTVENGVFADITWGSGPYFIKTEIDPEGGEVYTIESISQLLSVPYALYAKTAESISGTITETDPVYTESEAANITATDIINLSNLSGENTGDQDISGININTQAIQDTAAQIRAGIPDVSGFVSNETDPVYTSSIASGITAIDTALWNNKLDNEEDGDATNELQVLTISNDTIYLTDGGFVKLPAGFSGSFNDLEDVPANLDIDNTDDFDGLYSSLEEAPEDVSFFNNDAGYLTQDTTLDEAEVDAMVADNGYLTEETQSLTDVLSTDNDAGDNQIKNLAEPTEDKDAVTKAYVDEVRIMILDLQAELGVTDERDGTHYAAVRIGNQVWMAENLKYLPSVSETASGSEDVPGEYYYVYDYNGTDVNVAKGTTNYATYGVLYNWAAAMNSSESSNTNPSEVQGICPMGWHLPSDDEWGELFDYLGGTSIAGGKLKETGMAHWDSPNTDATNESSFTALPGGNRSGGGVFFNIGTLGLYWTASENSNSAAIYAYMSSNSSNATKYPTYSKETGYSVRCVKD